VYFTSSVGEGPGTYPSHVDQDIYGKMPPTSLVSELRTSRSLGCRIKRAHTVVLHAWQARKKLLWRTAVLSLFTISAS